MGSKEGARKARDKARAKFNTEEEYRVWLSDTASKAGKKGGAVSPTNFANNPSLASKAAKKRWDDYRKRTDEQVNKKGDNHEKEDART